MTILRVLVVGGGGREHAIIEKLKKSNRVAKIYAAPGNGGMCADAVSVDIKATDIDKMVQFAKDFKVDLCIVAPDDPLVLGMVDAMQAAGIRAFGPNRLAAAIEGSKVFSKDLMKKYNIPTASYEIFSNSQSAIKYVESCNKYPVVIKADGLSLGKGVIIAENFTQAENGIIAIMEDKVFGESGNNIVIEEFLTGPEVSVLSFCDSHTIVPMISAMDHKRALDGDKGLNTGGMGTIAPNPYYTEDLQKLCMDTIFNPTMDAMNKEGRPFKGIIFFGLMLAPNGPKVIEYNCRFGDPEAQVVLPLLKTDLLEIFEAIIDEKLVDVNIEFEDKAAACVIMASGGYPQKYETGKEIEGLNRMGQLDGVARGNAADITVYHSGTKLTNHKFLTGGGRVLGISAKGNNLEDALKKSYEGVDKISFEGAFCRSDIGKRALEK